MGKKRSSGRPRASRTTGPRRRRLDPTWAVPLLAVLVYVGTLGHGFTLDDVEIVQRNPVVTSGAGPGEIFGTPYWGDDPGRDRALYRPVTIASYAVGHALHGGAPGIYHLVNLLLHALVCLVLARLVRDLFGDERLALLAGALFAVHPIHTEAVAGIVGRAEVLALLGMLLAARAWFRAVDPAAKRPGGWAAVSIAAYVGGSLSKEGGLAAPALVILAEAFLPGRRRLLRGDRRAISLIAAWAAAAAGVLALRASVVEGSSVNEAFLGVSGIERFLTALRICGEYVGLLLAPVRLSADYWVMQVPIARSFAEPGVLVAALVAIAMAALAWRTARPLPAIAWGVTVFAATLFPVSNLALPIGVIKAERLLYAPSAGFLVAIAGLVAPAFASARWRRPVGAVAAIAIVGLGGMTFARSAVWRDDCTLAEATLERSPDSPIFLTKQARCRFDAGQPDEARALLDRALDVRPDFPTAHLLYGIIERDAEAWGPALARFEGVLGREPNHRVALDNAAWVAYRGGWFERSAEHFSRWCEIEPGNPSPWAGAIAAYAKCGRFDEAERRAAVAAPRFPNDPDVSRNVALLRSRDEGEGS